MIKYNIVLGAV